MSHGWETSLREEVPARTFVFPPGTVDKPHGPVFLSSLSLLDVTK